MPIICQKVLTVLTTGFSRQPDNRFLYPYDELHILYTVIEARVQKKSEFSKLFRVDFDCFQKSFSDE
jgi:hypothetical protein